MGAYTALLSVSAFVGALCAGFTLGQSPCQRSHRIAIRLGILLAVLLAAGVARGGERECSECFYTGELARLFVAPRALGPGWETVAEAPADPLADPDLRGAGVRTAHSLHYTRALRGGAEVCSVEIWGFDSPASARRARAGMERSGWRFAVHGNLVVMLRGATLRRGESVRPGLLPVCRRLGDLVDARAQEELRPAPAAELPRPAPER